MLAGAHIAQGDDAGSQFVAADECHVGHGGCIGPCHLFLHLSGVGVYLHGNALAAQGGGQAQGGSHFGGSEVGKHHLCAAVGAFGEEVERGHDIVDAVGAEADAHAAEAGSAEDAREVVVASAAGDAAYGCVQGLDFDDGAGVIVETACQRDIQIKSGTQSEVARPINDRA